MVTGRACEYVLFVVSSLQQRRCSYNYRIKSTFFFLTHCAQYGKTAADYGLVDLFNQVLAEERQVREWVKVRGAKRKTRVYKRREVPQCTYSLVQHL